MAEALILAISTFLGASLASFLFSLVHYPIRSLFRRSYCDLCHSVLKWYQLIPIVSSLIFRHQCRCGHRPSFKYGFGELILGLIFLINVCVFGVSYPGFLVNFLCLIGFYTSVVDLKTKKVPLNSLILIGVMGCAWVYHYQRLPWSVLGVISVIVFIFFIEKWFIKREKAIGEGDILLLLAAGIWLPWESLPEFLFLTGLLGVLTSFMYKRRSGFPFAPAIIISLWLTLLLS